MKRISHLPVVRYMYRCLNKNLCFVEKNLTIHKILRFAVELRDTMF